MKNKIWLCVMSLVVCMGLFVGCGKKEEHSTVAKAADETAAKYSVVCTIFPEYDWVKEIIKGHDNKYELTLLLDNGVDLHSYQPTAEDISKIADCDLFIYVGGESDGWVEDALKESTNPDMKVINLLDVLGDQVKEEEIVEGMQGEEEEEEDEEEEEGPEYDEHVWLSLKNAQILTGEISKDLQEIDAENKQNLKANTDAYLKELQDLDEQYQKTVEASSKKTVLFGDRFPFRYLVDDYGLDYYAAFVGCSAETEASFETVIFLAGKLDELGLNTVFTIENADRKIAETIIQNSTEKNQSIMSLDSMQSTTSKDIAEGATYLSAMKNNLDVLSNALK